MCDPRVFTKIRSAGLQMLRSYSSFSTDFTEFHARCKPNNASVVIDKYTKIMDKTKPKNTSDDSEQSHTKRVFSGIQPTGALHLGNYLGAVKQWTQLQNDNKNVSFCIVDLHSITTPQVPGVLRKNIIELAATMIACGIDQEKSTIFVQSSVKEHAELSWILGTHCTMARLGHLPQYKEKSRLLKEIPLGLYLYPVLQAADICLYKTTHVPVGEDQVQHIQLAQHLAKTFNNKYGETFPICHAVIHKTEAARIRSLRDPNKKMSKSDIDARSTINLMDEPEVIVEKFKKAMTDFTSDITYDPIKRPGVSNIVAIHALISGRTIKDVIEEASNLDTARYKLRVADAVIEHLKPIRSKITQLLQSSSEIAFLLEEGAKKARNIARETMDEVRHKVGLGTNYSSYLTDNKIHTEQNSDKKSMNFSLMEPPQNVTSIKLKKLSSVPSRPRDVELGEAKEGTLKN